MGWRYRRSLQLLPGVRLTFTPRGVGTSIGGRGFRLSRSPTGRITRTLSLPGTGLSNVETIKRGRPSRRAGATSTGRRTGPRWEDRLGAAIAAGAVDDVRQVGQDVPEARPHAALSEALVHALPNGEHDRARRLLHWVYRAGFDPATDPVWQRWMSDRPVNIQVADGLVCEARLARDTIALLLAELYQAEGEVQAALSLVRTSPRTPLTLAAECDLLRRAGQWDEIPPLLAGLTPCDEATAFAAVVCAEAFRRLGDAASALRMAEAVASQPGVGAALHHAALFERALALLASGRTAEARRDLSTVVAADPAHAQAQAALTRL